MTAAPPSTCFSLWNETCSRLDQVDAKPVSLPDEWSSAKGGEGKFTLTASCWSLRNIQARTVLIESKTSQIFNVLFYPDNSNNLPLFAAELLLVQDVPRLFFVDLPCPDASIIIEQQVQSATKSLRQTYQRWAYAEAAPNWAAGYSAGNYLYSRPGTTEASSDLSAAYLGYLDLWLDFQATVTQASNSSPGPELQEFKRLQRTESPGVGYLEKFFGPAWTQSFLQDFLHS